MAQQSNDKKKTSDQLAIQFGDDAMLTVTQDLFTVLNDLDKEQQAGYATENQALTSFLSAESALSLATNKFAGPSPRFNAPSWEGSTANPARASYKTAFTPIIHSVLNAPNAKSDEQAIESQLLAGAIKKAFETQALLKKINPGGTGFPTGTTPSDVLANQWIADSVLTLSGVIPEDVQTTLVNSIIKRVSGMKAKNLYTNMNYPHYWDNVADLEVTKGSTSGLIETAVGNIVNFIDTMWNSYKSKKNPSIQTDQAALVTALKAPDVLAALGNLTTNEQQYFQEQITQAVVNALSAMPSVAPTPASSLPAKNYSGIQGQLNTLNTASTNPFLEAFPTPQSNDKATFDGDFWQIIQQSLNGSAAAGAEGKKIKETKILNALHTSYKTLPPNPLDPNAPISDETEITTWVENTVANLASKQAVTQVQSEMLNSGLIDAVTGLFPIPDQISFYDTFQDNLTQALMSLPHKSPQSDKKKKQDDKNDNNKHTTSNSDKNKKHSSIDKKSAMHRGLRYEIEKNISTTNLKDIAANILKNQKAGQNNIVAEVIDYDQNVNDLSAITKQLSTDLTTAVEGVVNKAISNVFVSLSEQGVQGQMISTAYDYQLVNRISSYTNTLLNQLDKHYDVDVPENSAQSVAAAQAITAASVSYSNYADDLDSLQEVYERAGQTENSNSGRSTREIDLYIEGNQGNTTDKVWTENLKNIAEMIYGTNPSKEALILTSEYQAVQLAAKAAGFNSNLDDEFKQERQAAEAALNSLMTSSKQLFSTTQNSYESLSTDYFSKLSNYTEAKEAYKIDEAVSNANASALAGLTSIIEQGNVAYETASLATLSSS